jgi:hypothetical protein
MFTSLSEVLFHMEDCGRLCFQNALRAKDYPTQKEYFARYDAWMQAARVIRDYQVYLELNQKHTEG